MESTEPKSLSELRQWIYARQSGGVIDAWIGRPAGQQTVDEFKVAFTKLLRTLGEEVTLPEGGALDETKKSAYRQLERLILDNGEVPDGWEEAFADPRLAEYGLVSLPDHPVRTSGEVLKFMDHQREQARRSATHPLSSMDFGADRLKTGIKGAWLWLVQEGFETGQMAPLPVEPWKLSELFDDLYYKVKNATSGTRKPRKDEPSEADLLVGQRLIAGMGSRCPSVEAFRKYARANGLSGSNAKLGKVYAKCSIRDKNLD